MIDETWKVVCGENLSLCVNHLLAMGCVLKEKRRDDDKAGDGEFVNGGEIYFALFKNRERERRGRVEIIKSTSRIFSFIYINNHLT